MKKIKYANLSSDKDKKKYFFTFASSLRKYKKNMGNFSSLRLESFNSEI